MVKEDKVQIRTIVLGQEAFNELGKLEAAAKRLNQAMKGVDQTTAEYKSHANQLDIVTRKMEKMRAEMGTVGQTMAQLKARQKELTGELSKVTQGTDGYRQLAQQYREVTAEIKRQTSELKANNAARNQNAGGRAASGGGGAASLTGMLGPVAGLVASVAIFDTIRQKIADTVRESAKLSDELANVRKTTGQTAAEADAMFEAFAGLNTRTSMSDLNKIAEVGGQLGVGKNEIVEFTAAMDKLKVALGDEFGNDTEKLTRELGGLRDIFTDTRSGNLSKDITSIGNAINHLSATGAATSPVIANFASRIGGMGITMGLTTPQVLGLSATLEELKINAERGSSGFIRIIQKMVSAPDTFAKVARVSSAEFRRLVETDLFGAFKLVVKGTAESKDSVLELQKVMNDLGVDSIYSSEVMGKLAGNLGKLEQRVNDATGAIGRSDSILGEFNIKNNTLAANLDKMGKAINMFFVNTGITNALSKLASGFADLITPVEDSSKAIDKERVNVDVLTTRIMGLNVGNTERTKLIKELQAQYPDLLKNIDAEKISNDDLAKSIDRVNEGLINRIVIARKQDKINQEATKTAELAEKRAEAEVKLVEAMNQAAARFPALRAARQGTRTQDLRSQARAMIGAAGSGNNIIGTLLDEYETLDLGVNVGAVNVNRMDAEKRGLMQRFGMGATPTTAAPGATGGSGGTLGEQSEAARRAAEDAKRLREERLRAEADLLARLAQMQIEAIADEEARELASAALKANLEQKEIADSLASQQTKDALMVALAEDVARQQTAIRQKYFEAYQEQERKMAEEAEKRAKALLDGEEKLAKDRADVARRQGVVSGSLSEEQAALLAIDEEFEQKKAEKRREINQANLDVMLDDTTTEELRRAQLLNDELLVIEDQHELAKAELRGRYREKEKKTALEVAIEIGQGVQQALEIASQFQQVASQNEQRRLDQARLDRTRALDNEYRRGLISKEQFEGAKASIEEEYDAKMRAAKQDAAEKEKQANIVRAIMEGALAVLRAAPDPLRMGIAAALTIANTALIASTEIPAFAAGGATSVAGGGAFGSSPYLATVNERGPEYIIPNWQLRDPFVADTVGMLEALRTRGMSASQAMQGSTGGSGTPAWASELTAALGQLNANLQNPAPTQGIWDWDYYQRGRDRMEGIQRRSGAK